MDELIEEYRYLALMVGTFFEGETAILVASTLIYKGFFSGPLLVLSAFAGSFLSDWLYYLIGRLNGKIFVERRPKLHARILPMTNFFRENKIMILLLYRFLYGFRVIIPIVVGMSGISLRTFLFFSVLSGLLWAGTISTIGYFIGRMLGWSADDVVDRLHLVIIGCAAFAFIIGFVVQRFFKHRVHQ